jgi:C4-dicarboxylate-specific signal transduction histidine kinase
VRRSPVAEATFDLRDAVTAVAELLQKMAREASASIRVRRPRQAVLVTADRLQVEQALFNLARNAIEAVAESRRGPRTVTLAAAASDGHARVSVADNGGGIPVARVEKLFEPFHTTKPGGSGLGLAIARSIAEAQGGGLRLERNGPGGATFVIQLPGERRRPRGAKA